MAASTTIVVDKIKEAVQRCTFPVGFFSAGESLHFDHGHMMEISGKLLQVNQSLQKYPLVILLEDFEQDIYAGMIHLNLRLFIVTLNPVATMDAQLRYSTTVKPVLIPIYDELIKQLSAFGFSWDRQANPGNQPPHTMIVRTKFGVWLRDLKGTYKNILNDPLDGIEINNLKINITSKSC